MNPNYYSHFDNPEPIQPITANLNNPILIKEQQEQVEQQNEINFLLKDLFDYLNGVENYEEFLSNPESYKIFLTKLKTITAHADAQSVYEQLVTQLAQSKMISRIRENWDQKSARMQTIIIENPISHLSPAGRILNPFRHLVKLGLLHYKGKTAPHDLKSISKAEKFVIKSADKIMQYAAPELKVATECLNLMVDILEDVDQISQNTRHKLEATGYIN